MALPHNTREQSSSRALVKATPQGPVSNLRQALNEYERSLSDDERKEFHAQGKPDATAAIDLTTLVDRKNYSHRRQCMGTRLTIFLESMQQFSAIVDMFVSSHPEIAALVWGGVKLALLVGLHLCIGDMS